MSEVVFPVDASDIMILARALGDDNPVYRDPDSADAIAVGGIIAPPTFTEVRYNFKQDSGFRPGFGQPWYGSGAEVTGTPGVHPNVVDYQLGTSGDMFLPTETSFEYFEPLRPGDTITMTEQVNESWERDTARAGRVRFFDVIREFRNQHGRLAVSERIVFMIASNGVPNYGSAPA